MANGTTHDRLAEKVEALERRIEDRSARRDAESAEAREALAELAARLSGLEASCSETRSSVMSMQSIKPPGFLALAGPAIAAAVMVGSLGAWALDMTASPIKETLREVKDGLRHYQADVTARVRMVEERQDDVRTRLARLEGRTEADRQRLDDVDKFGSRKWVGKDVK